MKLFEQRIVVSKSGYVKDEDELEVWKDEARSIVDHYLILMREELDQAGYTSEVR